MQIASPLIEQQGRLSPEELEHVGVPCFPQTVIFTEPSGKTERVNVLASDNRDAINQAWAFAYPSLSAPKEGLDVLVIPFERRTA